MNLLNSTSQFFIKRSGVSLIFAGFVTGVFWLLTIPFESFAGVEVVQHPLFLPGQVFHAIGAFFTALGFVGIYLRLRNAPNYWVFISFLIAFLGALCFFADALIALVTFPVFANYAPELIDPLGAMFTGNAFGYFVAFAVLQMIGNISLGFAIWRSRQFRKIGIMFLVIGAILYNLPPIPGAHLLLVFGGVTWSIGAICLGRDLMSRSLAHPMVR